MKNVFIGNDGTLYDRAVSNDFIGATRLNFDLQEDQRVIVQLPKKFGWNTLVVSPQDGEVLVECSTSSPQSFVSGKGIWIPLGDCPGDLPESVTFNGDSMTADTFMYAWEHPVVAFGFSGTGRVIVEVTSKHD